MTSKEVTVEEACINSDSRRPIGKRTMIVAVRGKRTFEQFLASDIRQHRTGTGQDQLLDIILVTTPEIRFVKLGTSCPDIKERLIILGRPQTR